MKYLLDDDLYEETKRIALGKAKKSPFLMELSEWFLSTYSVKVLNIQFGKSEVPRIKGYRLYVILETTEDYQKMFLGPFQHNEEYMAQICDAFKQIALQHQYATKAQFRGMWVRYNDFSVEARTEANNKAIEEARAQIMKKHSMVWDVVADASYGAVVFYYAEQQVTDNQNNGISKLIEDDYYLLLKKYDELNFFTRQNLNLKFDSKENVDKNYEGNLFYYFR